MTGIVDVGGGMRGVFSAGIYDRFIEEGINFDLCIGVSAGSANLISYAAGHHDRVKRFYVNYAQRKQYMILLGTYPPILCGCDPERKAAGLQPAGSTGSALLRPPGKTGKQHFR